MLVCDRPRLQVARSAIAAGRGHHMTLAVSVITRLFSLSFICWFDGQSVRDTESLVLSREKFVPSGRNKDNQPDHILAADFKIMPSGQLFIIPLMKTYHYSKPKSAIRQLNVDSRLWD